MSDKVTWLSLEYDKKHKDRSLVTSGAFSEKFVEWAIDRASENKDEARNTGSPKLPTLAECEQHLKDSRNCVWIPGAELGAINDILNFINSRQLRAGA